MKMYKRKYAARARFLLEALAPEHKMVLCDVGANPANTPDYLPFQELGGCHVYGFEPGEKAFAKLQRLNPPNATYFNLAIGRPGKASFHAYPIGTLASTFRFHEPSVRYLGKENWLKGTAETHEIELVGLDEVEGLPPIDVLKMDLQGGELAVLETGREKLARAVAVIPEVRFYRMYEDEPLWAELDQELRAQGFVLHKLLFAKSLALPSSVSGQMGPAMRSQLLDGDAVYIRSLEAPDEVSTEELKQLALAADAIFQSFDLAAMCLDLLAARGAVAPETTRRYAALLPDHLMRAEEV